MKVNFCQKALQIGFVDVVMYARDAALQDRKEVLRRVCVDIAAKADTFVGRVIHYMVIGELAVGFPEVFAFIGHQSANAICVRNDEPAASSIGSPSFPPARSPALF